MATRFIPLELGFSSVFVKTSWVVKNPSKCWKQAATTEQHLPTYGSRRSAYQRWAAGSRHPTANNNSSDAFFISRRGQLPTHGFFWTGCDGCLCCFWGPLTQEEHETQLAPHGTTGVQALMANTPSPWPCHIGEEVLRSSRDALCY